MSLRDLIQDVDRFLDDSERLGIYIGQCVGVTPDNSAAALRLDPIYGITEVVTDCIIEQESWGWSHATYSAVSPEEYIRDPATNLPILDENGNVQIDYTKPGEYGKIQCIGGLKGLKIVKFGLRLGDHDWISEIVNELSSDSISSEANIFSVHHRAALHHKRYSATSPVDYAEFRDIVNASVSEETQTHLRHRPDGILLGDYQRMRERGESENPQDSQGLLFNADDYLELPLATFNREQFRYKEDRHIDEINVADSNDTFLTSNYSKGLLREAKIRFNNGNEVEIEDFSSFQFTNYRYVDPDGASTFKVGVRKQPGNTSPVVFTVSDVGSTNSFSNTIYRGVDDDWWWSGDLNVSSKSRRILVENQVERAISSYYSFGVRGR